MKTSPLHLLQSLLLVVAAGCLVPALAQDAGSLPPPPASAAPPAPAPASANQPAAQKPHDGSGGAPAAGGSAAPESAADGATTAGAAAVPAVAANGANSGAGTSGALAAPVTPAAAAAPVVAPSAKIMVPAGTHIPLVLHNAVSTRSARPGDAVYFETLFPVLIDGKVVIPAGSYMSGEVTEAKRAGRVKGRAELGIKLTTMILPNAYMVNLNAMPSSAGTGGGETVDQEGKVKGDTDKASDAGTVLKTTAAGAGIGGVAAQSGRGAGGGGGTGGAG